MSSGKSLESDLRCIEKVWVLVKEFSFKREVLFFKLACSMVNYQKVILAFPNTNYIGFKNSS